MGQFLPKNHEITDYLLEKACERKEYSIRAETIR
ncbi:glutamine amidotransferase [Staphylococcus gallinarum]|uniref:Glutamine amidotransferase n=1 Tax=Staphylococcus gallinarum TaxID=1293 RepID=A0A380FID5_STAGA|nr:glutamine amidotransferase [Staphylococcus gallinarum]